MGSLLKIQLNIGYILSLYHLKFSSSIENIWNKAWFFFFPPSLLGGLSLKIINGRCFPNLLQFRSTKLCSVSLQLSVTEDIHGLLLSNLIHCIYFCILLTSIVFHIHCNEYNYIYIILCVWGGYIHICPL